MPSANLRSANLGVTRSGIKPWPPAPRVDALTTRLCGGGLVTNDDARQASKWRQTPHVRAVCNTARTIAITSNFSLTGLAIHDRTRNHLATHDRYFFATFRAATICIPHEDTELEQHDCTVSQPVHKSDRHIRSQREPVLVIQRFTLSWGFSAIPRIISLSCLKPNHSTTTV